MLLLCSALSRPPDPPAPGGQLRSQLTHERAEVLTGQETLQKQGEVNCMGCPALCRKGGVPGKRLSDSACPPSVQGGGKEREQVWRQQSTGTRHC